MLCHMFAMELMQSGIINPFTGNYCIAGNVGGYHVASRTCLANIELVVIYFILVSNNAIGFVISRFQYGSVLANS